MASDLTARQMVELFHLVFVRALFAGMPDKRLIAIKGGINLRFFFDSVRHSEDIDFDVVKMSKGTLEKRIDGVLASPAVVAPLKSRGVTIHAVSKPKQTDTVQRWKLELALSELSLVDRTKIEFSRRADVNNAESDRIADAITGAYSMPSFVATHYRCREAISQKIHALAARTEPQPRDVFDLHVLFARTDAPKALDEEARGWIARAADNALEITYERYLALVVAFLEPAHEAIYSAEETWEAMQREVVERMLELS